MNIVEIAGHLGKDPETRFTTNGQKVTTLTVAANSRKNGKDETVWWRVTIWGDRFDKMMPYLKKGSAVIVIGEMHKPEIYTDKEGRPQVSVEMTAEIIRFSPFGKSERSEGNAQNNSNAYGSERQQPFAGSSESYTSQAAGGFSPFSANSNASAYAAPQHNDQDDEHIPF